MFGNNIKVHFAGCEQLGQYECAADAGVRYSLFSVLSFIAKKFVTAWTESLCEFVLKNNIRASCVEVDCQKILGVSEAWKMRKRMRELLPDRRIINVFHVEDGRKGLDRLVEYSDYIAISVPELRRHYGFGKAHVEAVIRLANYIKNRKPSIDIHLLGCTTTTLLRECRFCTSADFTSRKSLNRYGNMSLLGVQRSIKNINRKALEPICNRIERRFRRRGIQIGNIRETYARFSICARSCLHDYTRAAGDQS